MSHTEVLRRFNRTYTQRIGALDDSFLGLGLPLAPVRLLHEIGTAGADAASLGDLRDRLDLDSGHLSRLLRTLERRGLVVTGPDPDDGRRRVVTPTDAGRRFLADVETRSEEKARGLVDPLTERQRERLTEALATADLLVRAATVHLREVPADGALARISVGRYVAELAALFPAGFDPGTPPPLDLMLVATSDGAPVACGGLQRLEADPDGSEVDEVKRMWVDPTWRGAGLGGRLLRALEESARGRGAHVVRLDTNGALADAIGMYERAGYRAIERYNDNPYAELFFEKALS